MNTPEQRWDKIKAAVWDEEKERLVLQAIREAVTEERQACARIARGEQP